MMSLVSRLKQFLIRKIRHINGHDVMMRHLSEMKVLSAQTLLFHMKQQGVFPSLHDAELQVFSQFGEDGILQYLIQQTGTTHRTFIEFGVQDYWESNTRFLLIHNNWRGLILDGSQAYIDAIKRQHVYWSNDLTAACAFLTVENINDLFASFGFSGDIGILSVDVDGNDYYLWDAIEVVTPDIVVCEYNAIFGPEFTVSVPYNPSFQRETAHHSYLYFGASLAALHFLANQKGYALVGCNSNGNNAFFVRHEKLGELRSLSAQEAYVKASFREARDPAGRLLFQSQEASIPLIETLPLYDVVNHRLTDLKTLRAQ